MSSKKNDIVVKLWAEQRFSSNTLIEAQLTLSEYGEARPEWKSSECQQMNSEANWRNNVGAVPLHVTVKLPKSELAF